MENYGIGVYLGDAQSDEATRALAQGLQILNNVARGVTLARSEGKGNIIHLMRYAKTKRARERNYKRFAQYLVKNGLSDWAQ